MSLLEQAKKGLNQLTNWAGEKAKAASEFLESGLDFVKQFGFRGALLGVLAATGCSENGLNRIEKEDTGYDPYAPQEEPASPSDIDPEEFMASVCSLPSSSIVPAVDDFNFHGPTEDQYNTFSELIQSLAIQVAIENPGAAISGEIPVAYAMFIGIDPDGQMVLDHATTGAVFGFGDGRAEEWLGKMNACKEEEEARSLASEEYAPYCLREISGEPLSVKCNFYDAFFTRYGLDDDEPNPSPFSLYNHPELGPFIDSILTRFSLEIVDNEAYSSTYKVEFPSSGYNVVEDCVQVDGEELCPEPGEEWIVTHVEYSLTIGDEVDSVYGYGTPGIDQLGLWAEDRGYDRQLFPMTDYQWRSVKDELLNRKEDFEDAMRANTITPIYYWNEEIDQSYRESAERHGEEPPQNGISAMFVVGEVIMPIRD